MHIQWGRMMISAAREQNAFLRSLSADDLEALQPHLKTVELPAESTLVELGQPVANVYFPHRAVIALVVEFRTGERVEVALVGPDSLLGAFDVMGEPVASITATVVLPGPASVIEVDRFRTAARHSKTLHEAVARHSQALYVQAQQTAACNALHGVSARLARWLLRVRDLSGSDRFRLTQEYIAAMIGSRRNAVSLAAHTLQQLNIIRYSRGHIEISDVEALKKNACECYGELRAQYQRLRFPVDPSNLMRSAPENQAAPACAGLPPMPGNEAYRPTGSAPFRLQDPQN
jgi:CRP-like cAMP-binding protein